VKWAIKLAVMLCMLVNASAWAQVATITGQIVDSDNQQWFGGTYQIKFINSQPGTVAYRSDTLQPFPQSFFGTLDSTGSFSVQLTQTNFIIPANSQWQFTVCSQVTGWSCGSITVPITASGQVGTLLNAVILAPRVTGGPGIKAYSDIEVSAFPNNSYFNVTSQLNRCYSTSWAVCQGGGGGGAVSSVFGRAGAVTAQVGDYTCSQVTGCITSIPVTSVFGRTGAITPQTGDYNCSQVTGCAPGTGWTNQLAGLQSANATTIQLTSANGVPANGTFFVDGEYETFSSVNYATSTLSGITRGVSFTTPTAHAMGALAQSAFPLTAYPSVGVFGNTNTLASNNGFPVSGQPFTVNSGGNELDVTNTGAIAQVNSSTTNYLAPIMVGIPGAHNDGTNYVVPITNTSYLVQDNAPHELSAPIGDSAGFAGVVTSIPAPTVGGAALYPVFITGGTCNITYVVTGVDVDGVEVPGTASSVSGLSPWGFPASVTIRYPSAAGVVSYNGYRTAVSSGCTGLALGKFASGVTGNFGAMSDFYTGGDGTSPPAVNNSIGKSCVGSTTNKELFCSIAGASGTPPLTCSASTAGWVYYNTAATVAPFSLQCVSGAWISTNSGGSATPTGAAGGSLSGTYPNPGIAGLTAGQPAGANAAASLGTMKYFYADLFPSSCTVNSVAYTTQADCAFYTAQFYATTNSVSPMLLFGAGTYTTAKSFVMATGNFVPKIYGSGQQGTILQYTGATHIPVISRANGTSAFLDIHNMTIDGNYLASAEIDLLNLNQSYISDLTLINNYPNTTYFFRVASGFQVNVERVQAFENSGSGLGNFNSATTYGYVTCTPSSGTIATAQCTLTSAGSGYPSGYATPSIIWNGNQNGNSYRPCSGTQPVGTATVASGAVTGFSVTTSGTSCVGTAYGIIVAQFPVTYGFDFQVSDSSFRDLTSYVGKTAGFWTPTNNDFFYHLHPAFVSTGILNAAANNFTHTELDSIFQYGMDLQGPNCAGGSACALQIGSFSDFIGAKNFAGFTSFYMESGANNTSFGPLGSLCGGTPPTGYTEFATATGTIDSGIGSWPAATSLIGNDLSCGSTVGDYIPTLKNGTINGTVIPTSQTLMTLGGSNQTVTQTPLFSGSFTLNATASTNAIQGAQSRAGANQGVYNFLNYNSTAATSGQNYNSPCYALQSNYWNGTASTAAEAQACLQFGAGSNPSETYQFNMFGTPSTGSKSYAFDEPIRITDTTAPTMVAGAAAGSAPNCTTVTGNNNSMVVACTTGTSTTSSATLATITFNGTLLSAPNGCSLTPRNSSSAAAAASVYTTAPSTTSFTIGVGAVALTAATNYSWSLQCF
jgi:hypothetical protein